ncbi:hypothetical protein MMC10_004986 [Thelotrema lepadinum]|nr:hypothetical protein [Thelotrema lepadinum]
MLNKYDVDIPTVPRAHLTGMRTFIDARGRTNSVSNQLAGKNAIEEEEIAPLSQEQERNGAIVVRHDISTQSTRVSDDSHGHFQFV